MAISTRTVLLESPILAVGKELSICRVTTILCIDYTFLEGGIGRPQRDVGEESLTLMKPLLLLHSLLRGSHQNWGKCQNSGKLGRWPVYMLTRTSPVTLCQ